MKKLMLAAVAAMVMFGSETETNGMKISMVETTEGVSIFVRPSSCNTEGIRVTVRTENTIGTWDAQHAIKTVIRCDARPVEFRFKAPGRIVLIAAYEMGVINTGAAK